MNCLLPLFAACFFNPSHVAFEADASWYLRGGRYYFALEPTLERYDGPLARVAATVHMPVSKRFSFTYGAQDVRFLETGDGDEQRWFIGFAWRAWERRQVSLHVDGGASWRLSGERVMGWHEAPYTGTVGRLAASLRYDLTRKLAVRAGIEHGSYIGKGRRSGDPGEERGIIGLAWHPF